MENQADRNMKHWLETPTFSRALGLNKADIRQFQILETQMGTEIIEQQVTLPAREKVA